ncbi:MAG TPA: GNAT family N-acetyltransferase [Dermatophilaceae bacterium]|nr:MAG: Acetyltransferase Pat [bacterium ADurb.BinA028]HOA58897.1 GNAT family N-acetyltransferase [Dermatophilaceae bacterium]
MTTTMSAPALPGTREWRLGLPAWIHDARGAELLLRFVAPADEGAIRALHSRCSERALRWRYFGGGPQVDHLLTWIFDETRSEAVTAWSHGQLVALGNLLLPDADGVGEVAFLVEDAWQGRGIGSTLVDVVTDRGRDNGARLLHADVSLDNGRMRVLLARRGWLGKVVDGDYCMDLLLDD